MTLGTTSHIYLAVDPQDGRKGIDGLAGAVVAASAATHLRRSVHPTTVYGAVGFRWAVNLEA